MADRLFQLSYTCHLIQAEYDIIKMYQIPECLEVCILPHLRGHLQVLRVIIERGELLSSGREKSGPVGEDLGES